MEKTYIVGGEEWLWNGKKWGKVFNSPQKIATLKAIEKNRENFSKLSVEEVQELKNLLMENIKIKPIPLDLKELHSINLKVLFMEGFDKWFADLQKINPGRADAILDETIAVSTVDQELDWFNNRVKDMEASREF